MPDPTATSVAPEMTQHTRWTDGDFTITTSDNIRFSVPSFYLQSASRVFRDMIDVGTGPKHIELDETACTIEQFLELVVDVSTRFRYDGDNSPNYEKAVSLAQFLKRYDCPAAQRTLAGLVNHTYFGCKVCVLRALVAMHLDLPILVAKVIREQPDLFYREHITVPGTEVVSYRVLQLIPSKYLWALLAADLLVPNSTNYPSIKDFDKLDDWGRDDIGKEQARDFMRFLEKVNGRAQPSWKQLRP